MSKISVLLKISLTQVDREYYYYRIMYKRLKAITLQEYNEQKKFKFTFKMPIRNVA